MKLHPFGTKVLAATSMAAALLASPAVAQVSVGAPDATTGIVEVQSPLRLDIDLGPKAATDGASGAPGVRDLKIGEYRSFPEVSRFVCDEARIRMASVKKVAEDAGYVELEVKLLLLSDWPLQDVRLSATITGAGDKKPGEHFWPLRTIGRWSGASKPTVARFRIGAADWNAAHADGKAPTLTVVAAITD